MTFVLFLLPCNYSIGQESHITNTEYYLDNIFLGCNFDLNNTPEQLKDYYKTIDKYNIKKVRIIKESEKETNQVFIITKECSSTYLWINKQIDKYLDHNDKKKYRVIYHLNNKLLDSNIYIILRIKKRQIKGLRI